MKKLHLFTGNPSINPRSKLILKFNFMEVIPKIAAIHRDLHRWGVSGHKQRLRHYFSKRFKFCPIRRIRWITKAPTPWHCTPRMRGKGSFVVSQSSSSASCDIIHARHPVHCRCRWGWCWWRWKWIALIGCRGAFVVNSSFLQVFCCLYCFISQSPWSRDEKLGIGTNPKFSSWKRRWPK